MPKGKTLGKRRNNIYREIALAETALGPTTGMN